MFSFKRLKNLFSFGWKILVSSLLYTLYNDLRTLLIGKLYTAEDLAYYNKAKTFPNFIILNINTSIDSVLLPTMSSVQDNRDSVKKIMRRGIKTSTYIMMPLMVGLAVCAKPIVSLILTDKWLMIVPYMRIFCFSYALYPINTLNLNAIKAMGRSDLFLKLEIAKKIVGLVFLLGSIRFGVLAMAYTLLITSVLNLIINAWPNKKLLNYNVFEQVKDICANMFLAVFMGACVACFQYFDFSNLLTLAIQIPVGAVIYILASAIFKMESFYYILGVMKNSSFCLLSALGGALVGAAIAMLVTPQSGKELRGKIRTAINDTAERVRSGMCNCNSAEAEDAE